MEEKYRTRVVDDLSSIGAARWDALIRADADGNALLSYAFLHALHASGSACAATGWHPRLLTLWQGERLAAAAPLYAKAHSYGEYVFDWAWAQAYQRHGLRYYPKGLVAVPFTPVGGSRLIAADEPARAALAQALLRHGAEGGLSSLHVLFAPPAQIDRLRALGFIVRHGVQFHWHNRGFARFDDFLSALAQPKRKKIRAERRRVQQAGVSIRQRVGPEIGAADWRFFKRCYDATYAAHGSTPYLDLDFFLRIGATLPGVVMFTAVRDGRPIAASLGLFDTSPGRPRRLYGRYWGAVEDVPCLHFECCYYRMIEFAIERRLDVFEGGAQGAHKLARGLDPVPTVSAHWLAQPQMHEAVARFVARETLGVGHALDELNEHRAWRRAGAAPTRDGA